MLLFPVAPVCWFTKEIMGMAVASVLWALCSSASVLSQAVDTARQGLDILHIFRSYGNHMQLYREESLYKLVSKCTLTSLSYFTYLLCKKQVKPQTTQQKYPSSPNPYNAL